MAPNLYYSFNAGLMDMYPPRVDHDHFSLAQKWPVMLLLVASAVLVAVVVLLVWGMTKMQPQTPEERYKTVLFLEITAPLPSYLHGIPGRNPFPTTFRSPTESRNCPAARPRQGHHSWSPKERVCGTCSSPVTPSQPGKCSSMPTWNGIHSLCRIRSST